MKRSNAAFSLKVMRDLTRDKPRAVLVVAAMSLGLIASGVILDSRAVLAREMDRNYMETDPACASIFLDGDGKDALAAARSFPGVADAELRQKVVGRIKVDGAWKPFWIYVCTDAERIRIDKFRILDSAGGPGTGEILIEKAAFGFLKARVGGNVEVEIPGKPPASLRVGGVAHAPGLAPAWMERIGYGFMEEEGARAIGFDGALRELKILSAGNRMDAAANKALALALTAELESQGIGTVRTEVLPPGRHPHATQMNSLLYLLGLFGFIAFILASTLCASVIAGLMARQRRESGVLRAIGATGARVFSGYLALALSISAISLVIAVPSARLLSILYARYTAGILNFTIASARVGFAPYLIQVLLGVLVPALVAAVPLALQSRLSVRECLSDVGKAARKSMPLGSGPASLPARNAVRKPARLLFATLSIGLGMALFMAAGSIRSSIRWTIDTTAEAQSFDIALWLSAPVPREKLQSTLNGAEGIDRAVPAVRTTAVLLEPDGSASDRAFNLTCVPPVQDLLSLNIEKGAWFDPAEPEGLVVNNLLADREGLGIGQRLRVKAGDRVFEGKIVGIARETIGFAALYAPLTAGQAVNAAYIAVKEGREIEGACSELETVLPRSGMAIEQLSPLAEMRKAIEEHMVLITTFLSAVSLAVFLVGLAAIASSIGMSVLERTREIGVLRAIGASPGRITALIGLEGAAMGGIGYLVALFVSLPLSAGATSVFGLIMFDSPLAFRPDLGLAALVLPFALVSGFLAALAPGVSAARKSVSANLRFE